MYTMDIIERREKEELDAEVHDLMDTAVEDDDEPDFADDNSLADFIEDDDGGGYAAPMESREQMYNYYNKQKMGLVARKEGNEPTVVYKGDSTEPQAPFQPGATPLRGTRRFLGMFYVFVPCGSQAFHLISLYSFHSVGNHPLS
jgi:hypothetical protein